MTLDSVDILSDITVNERKFVTLLDLENAYAVANKLQQFIEMNTINKKDGF